MDEAEEAPAFSDAFAALYRRAYQAAFRLTGDRSASEDLAQEALTRAYVRWDTLDARREGWVVTTTVHLAIGRWRKEGRPARPIEPRGEAPVDAVAAERLDLMRLLAALPRRQRQVAVLRYLEDRPEREVAELLGCSVGSVKRHASRAAAALRAGLVPPATQAPEVP